MEDGDFGEEGSQRRARHENLVEVYTDASFASNQLKSMSVVGFFAGAPVFWITCRQSFVTLSTAESELMSMLEGLTALRCVKTIVHMLLEKEIEGRMFSDSMAGISIVAGTTGSWRTKHLRIRAQGLHEALERGETTLEHQSGKILVADGMTKQLQGRLLQHFIQALKMTSETQEVKQVKSFQVEGDQMKRLTNCLGLLVASSSMAIAEAAEDVESPPEGGTGWMILMMILAAVLVLADMISRFGISTLRSWMFQKLKVKLLDENAVMPQRGSDGAAGWDLSSVEEHRIPPNDYRLIRTGIAVELPRDTYGRVAERSSLASRGLRVGGGVIDRDYRGEIKVMIHNFSNMECLIRTGDRIAQLIIEKTMEVDVQLVDTLSTTRRGTGGFGSTNSTDPHRGVTSFSVRRVGDVQPTAPLPERVERASSSSTLSRPMSSSMASTTEVQQSQPLLRNQVLTENEWEADEMRREKAFVENLKNRRTSSPLPDTIEGYYALIGGRVPGGASTDFPEYWLVDRTWCGNVNQSMEELIKTYRIDVNWPLSKRADGYELVINQPRVGGTDTTRTYVISRECSLEVRCHHGFRRKLYDFESAEGYGKNQLTLAWFGNGQKMVISSKRRGKRSPMLDALWTGYTIHLKTIY